MDDYFSGVGESVGIERRDVRNLAFTVGIMSLVLFAYVQGPLIDRMFTAVVGGVISGIVFLVVTLVINQIKPDHW